MRLPTAAHLVRPWRIREIAPDFTVQDVWALPVQGGAEDFDALIDLITSSDPTKSESAATRALWGARDRVGGWLGLGRVVAAPGEEKDAFQLPIPGTRETSLAERLPEDLRNTAARWKFRSMPFVSLYRTDVEFAAELSNQTVHAVMHLGWVDQGEGRYAGQMAVYVKPRGRLGKEYLAAITPFRHWIVYPALLRQIERSWNRPARQ